MTNPYEGLDTDSPAVRTKAPGLLVLLGGGLTSLLSLAIVFVVSVVSQGRVNLMGIYLWYVIPVSAICVGVAAGSGYSIVSWLRGIRVPDWLWLIVIILMVTSYFLAQYAEYVSVEPEFEDGSAVPFWTYFDLATRSFSFGTRHGQTGELGVWGYGLRALEIIGFTLGGVIPLGVLAAVSYCERCRMYFKKKIVAFIPAGPERRRIKKSDTAAAASYDEEKAAAREQAKATVAELRSAMKQADRAQIADLLRELPRTLRQANRPKRTAVLEVALDYCPSCLQATAVITELAPGKNNEVQRIAYASFSIPPGATAEALNREGAPTLRSA